MSVVPLEPVAHLTIQQRRERAMRKMGLTIGPKLTAIREARGAIASGTRTSLRNAGGAFAYRKGDTPPFITGLQLAQDVQRLASMLPADTSRIVGIARSGLSVAAMLGMALHRPIDVFRQSKGDLIEGGNGWRLTGNSESDGPVVVIDDTCMTGSSFRHVMPIIRKTHPDAIAAAVYVNPSARVKPDIWVRDLPWPHILAWNAPNSILSPSIAVDFDGILCHDCAHSDDDDGPRYAQFLAETLPLYIFRKVPIPLIVTARLEKYRPQTLAWLAVHGMQAVRLVMGPWANNAERARADIAAFKAEHYRTFLRRNHNIKPPMFWESEPAQAKRIAELSGGLVVCPAAGRCYGA